jgi:hypothetical protein
MTSSPVAAQALLDALLALPQGGPLPPPPSEAAWREVDALARGQDLQSFLRAAVDNTPLAPPPDLAASWRRRAWEDLARGQLMRQELLEALGVLNTVGIPVVLLKGAALCVDLYRDWSPRPLGDLDLLVPEADARRALLALQAAGYVLTLGHDELVERDSGPDLEALVAYHAQVTLHAPRPPGVVVDLHWHLFDRPAYRHGLSMAGFWAGSRPVDLEGRAARLLAPEAMVLHLAGHRAIHHPEWPGLSGRWRHDLAVLLRAGGGPDWPGLVAAARRCRLLGPLRAAVADLPAWAVDGASAAAALDGQEATDAERRALAWVAVSGSGQLRQALDQLRHLPGAGLRLRYLAAKLLPSPAYMRRRYGRPGAVGRDLLGLYLARLARPLRRAGGASGISPAGRGGAGRT